MPNKKQSVRHFEGEISLRLLAVLCFVSTICIVVSVAGLLNDTPYAMLPRFTNATRTPPAYQLLADFDNEQHDVVGISIRVRRANNRTRILLENRTQFFEYCNASFGDECEYATGATSIAQHKTITLGLLQHPGMCIVGILVPAITVLLGFLLLSVSLHSKVLFITSTKTFIMLAFLMSVSETGFEIHYFAGLVFYICFILSHFFITVSVRRFYRFNWIYRIFLSFYALLVFILCVCSLTSINSKHFVDFQIAVVSLTVPLQFFVSHIMFVISPVTFSTVLSDQLKPEFDSDFCEVAETPTTSFRVEEKDSGNVPGKSGVP
jgi:hypothetical protein